MESEHLSAHSATVQPDVTGSQLCGPSAMGLTTRSLSSHTLSVAVRPRKVYGCRPRCPPQARTHLLKTVLGFPGAVGDVESRANQRQLWGGGQVRKGTGLPIRVQGVLRQAAEPSRGLPKVAGLQVRTACPLHSRVSAQRRPAVERETAERGRGSRAE